MKKREFLNQLEEKLQGLPKSEIDERINFYDEMIQDIMEEGKSEEEAVESLGSFSEVVTKIADETKITSLVKERVRPKRKVSAFEIVLLILGFPLWFPFLIVGFVLFMVFLMLMWILVIVTYSVEAALISGGVTGLIASVYGGMQGEFYLGNFAVSILCIGLALVFLVVCFYATKLNFKFIKVVLLKVKSSLIGGRKNG